MARVQEELDIGDVFFGVAHFDDWDEETTVMMVGVVGYDCLHRDYREAAAFVTITVTCASETSGHGSARRQRV